jgi:hypothetical protein
VCERLNDAVGLRGTRPRGAVAHGLVRACGRLEVMDVLRPEGRMVPQHPTETPAPDRRDPGLAHRVRVPKKVKGWLHEPLRYHWRRRRAIYCGLSRVPLAERVTRERCLHATRGDMHEEAHAVGLWNELERKRHSYMPSERLSRQPARGESELAVERPFAGDARRAE